MKHPTIIFACHGEWTQELHVVTPQIKPRGLQQAKNLATKLLEEPLKGIYQGVSVITSAAPWARDYAVALSGIICPCDLAIYQELWSSKEHPGTSERTHKAAYIINQFILTYAPKVIIVITHTEFLAKIPSVLFKMMTNTDLRGTIPELLTGRAMMFDYDAGTVVSI